jgi:hypothetical protein
LNKKLNSDNAIIAPRTHKNKCKVVDLEGENDTKSNLVIEESYDYIHPLEEAIVNPFPFAPLFQTHSFISFNHLEARDVMHRPITKMNLVKPPIIRC